MKGYYMTAESTDDELYEHHGNIRGARTIAQRLANERDETVYINSIDTEDIVDCAFPHRSDNRREMNRDKGYKEMLIRNILEWQTKSQFTKERLEKKTIRTLERIHDNV